MAASRPTRRGRFQKGQSGNPAGRPRSGQSLAEHIRQLAGEDGQAYVQVLHRLATGLHRDTRARLTAIGLLLERGFGRPPQTVDIQGVMASLRLDESALRGLDDDQLAALARAREVLRAVTGATEGTTG